MRVPDVQLLKLLFSGQQGHVLDQRGLLQAQAIRQDGDELIVRALETHGVPKDAALFFVVVGHSYLLFLAAGNIALLGVYALAPHYTAKYCGTQQMNEKNSGIAARLIEERERLHLSQPAFAEMGGAKLRTLQNWEGAKNFPSSEFLADAAKFGIDVQYIITGHRSLRGAAPSPASADNADVLHVPLYSIKGSMGNGNDLLTEDVLMGETPVSRKWVALHLPHVRPDALQMIHAYGDSMLGTLNSGDFALVDTDVSDIDIDGVYVLQADDKLFIKRVTRRMNGRLEVTSDNPTVKTVEVLNGSHEVRICGRVVYGWNGRRF